MCGEHLCVYSPAARRAGSSPHVRGALVLLSTAGELDGIIPACAGSTSATKCRQAPSRDHPRMCGEHFLTMAATVFCEGSSPHVRGALNVQQTATRSIGIIPACAGSTQKSVSRFGIIRDHPRMCGEHRPQRKAISAMPGSSPHVRGARTLLHRVGSREGIIPACAGSTFFPVGSGPHCRDHPRMCGEHLESLNPTSPTQGSSPHVRGAHGHVSCHVGAIGIIPACAGSTHMDNDLNNMGRDHPRMCGEHPYG